MDIAAQLGVPAGTVRRWKSTYDWDNERSEQSERSDRQANVREEAERADVAAVMENPALTDKQRLFCLHYVRCFSATKAAAKAGYSKDTAMEQGYQLLRKPSVRAEVDRLKQNRLNREALSTDDVFQKYIDIAFADITDFVDFGQDERQVMAMYGPVMVDDPTTGGKVPLTETVNTVRFRESGQVDGSLITEVSMGRNGAKLKLADKMKALDWLAAHMDLMDTATQKRLELERQKFGSGDEDGTADDGFLEALRGEAKTVWQE